MDRIVRYVEYVKYVEYNPVGAGLAENPRAWPGSSARLAGESESACLNV